MGFLVLGGMEGMGMDHGGTKKEVVEVIVMGKVNCDLCEELAASMKRVAESKSMASIPGVDVRFRSLKAMAPEDVLSSGDAIIEEQREIYTEMAFLDAFATPSVVVKNGHVLLRRTNIRDLRDVTGGDVKRAIQNAIGGIRALAAQKVQRREVVDAPGQAVCESSVDACAVCG